MNTMTQINLDAEGKKIGRLATEIAHHLRGKHLPTFTPNENPLVRVVVKNAAKMDIPADRLVEEYFKHSGFPGGVRFISKERMIEKHGIAGLLTFVVSRMLPRNRMRKAIMKNLEINA